MKGKEDEWIGRINKSGVKVGDINDIERKMEEKKVKERNMMVKIKNNLKKDLVKVGRKNKDLGKEGGIKEWRKNDGWK